MSAMGRKRTFPIHANYARTAVLLPPAKAGAQTRRSLLARAMRSDWASAFAGEQEAPRCHVCRDKYGFVLANGEYILGEKRARAHEPFAGRVASGKLDG